MALVSERFDGGRTHPFPESGSIVLPAMIFPLPVPIAVARVQTAEVTDQRVTEN
ncbi:hypothetical protein [Natrinema sp. SYSU A 869]|uniref:hypothetical protein n=1 Tax=Natrinema sp. SYSU A 869 TaxID=2871694 RepID=UPI001CA39E3B|nr:hypothetical protein [Natrinema sp. SYSU A 869]